MSRPELFLRAGKKLQKIRVRLGLSVRDVERLSIELANKYANPFLSLSRSTITDVENGRFAPGSFKMVSLAEIYGMDLSQIHELYGLSRDITRERPVFRPRNTQLITPAVPKPEGEGSMQESTESEAAETNLLTGMVDLWGSVPVPILRPFALRKCLYGYIGTEDASMAPLLPPGSLVQIDARQNRIRKGPFPKSSGESRFARPIYFLDIRTGYICGWCELKDGVLTIVPHPDSGAETRSYRHPDEVTIVGRVTAVTMSIEEERFVRLDDPGKGRSSPKK
jgi:transcriptional regulator with XRE-family HTH domain